jgi:queuine tRNA-ribosyltransferase
MAIFSIRRRDSRARTGFLTLPHGTVQTPVFMPVGTNGTVKALSNDDLIEIGFSIILANTYHLYLRPGAGIIAGAGGLPGFTGWTGNFLTDSGGFQIFSLASLRKITVEGAAFRSHIDGSSHMLSPEKAVEIQVMLNSDIQMQLDVCTPFGITEGEAKNALDITAAWLGRAKAAWLREAEKGYQGSLFAIVQGNFYKPLRDESIRTAIEADLPGIAIGGLSVGEPREVFTDYLDYTASLLPEEKPRYVMGIGTPEYILDAIAAGIDMFDCVFPTRTGRNGYVFTSRGPFSLKRAENKGDYGPVDETCACKVCKTYSRSYLRHLFKTREILCSMLASYHNLFFLHDLVRKSGEAVNEGRFLLFRKHFLEQYQHNREAKP